MTTLETDAQAQQAVDLFKCLADLNRLRILALLAERPLCVCHLEAILGIGPVRTSQQLAYLKRHGLVCSEVRGTWRIYSLAPSAAPELKTILAALQPSVLQSAPFVDDRRQIPPASVCP